MFASNSLPAIVRDTIKRNKGRKAHRRLKTGFCSSTRFRRWDRPARGTHLLRRCSRLARRRNPETTILRGHSALVDDTTAARTRSPFKGSLYCQAKIRGLPRRLSVRPTLDGTKTALNPIVEPRQPSFTTIPMLIFVANRLKTQRPALPLPRRKPTQPQCTI